MSGIGKFKLSDALPRTAPIEGAKGGSGKAQGRSKKATAGEAASGDLAAEQAREIREAVQAKNAGPTIRDDMVDVGRGNQQAGRQGTGGRRGK
jgi:hypothetical protein